MKIFISGGCKNGKSSYAQEIAVFMAEHTKKLYYIATMLPKDDEDNERVIAHQKNRENLGFETIEISNNIKNILYNYDLKGSFLLDSTTALLANEMFLENKIIEDAYIKVSDDIKSLLQKINNIVIVSDYIYSDSYFFDEYTESYKKGLAFVDKVTANNCDVVLEASFGNIIIHKGKNIFGDIYEKIV